MLLLHHYYFNVRLRCSGNFCVKKKNICSNLHCFYVSFKQWHSQDFSEGDSGHSDDTIVGGTFQGGGMAAWTPPLNTLLVLNKCWTQVKLSLNIRNSKLQCIRHFDFLFWLTCIYFQTLWTKFRDKERWRWAKKWSWSYQEWFWSQQKWWRIRTWFFTSCVSRWNKYWR